MSAVALINMPWYSIKLGCISLGILKRALRRKRISSDVFHFNLQLAARMNLKVYEELSELLFVGDWLFSQHLFGPFGSGELKNGHEDLFRDPREEIHYLARSSKIDFQKIAVEIIPEFLSACLENVPWQDYRVIGFTSMFTQHVSSLLLAKRIKERCPQLKIVFGGANLDGVMGRETLRAFEWIDYVVDGEGERVFPELVWNILHGDPYQSLPGVSYRKDEELYFSENRAPATPMNDIPVPDYTEYYSQLEENYLRDRMATMMLFESARGCWWGEKSHCTFCGLNGQSMKFRAKSPRRVLREIVALTARHEVLDLQAVDNIMDMHYFSTLLPQLAEKKLDIHLFYEMKSNLKKEQVTMLRDSGVRYLQAGVESLNSEILKMMRKGVTAFQNIRFLKWCKELGIHVKWNYLYRFPGESSEQYLQTMDTIFSVMHLPPPTLPTKIILDRFSPYFTHPSDFGIENVEPSSFYEYIYPAGRVRMDSLAFHFNYSTTYEKEDPKNYLPFKKAIALWRELYGSRKIYFHYRKGPGFTELIDNRPHSFSNPVRQRRTVLRGLQSRIYEACESGKSFKQIYQFLAGSGKIAQESELRTILGDFVEKRLVFRENDSYLSLAVPYLSS